MYIDLTAHEEFGRGTVAQKLVSWTKPFNSHKWPRQNFSLQYQYNIKQTSDKNIEKYL